MVGIYLLSYQLLIMRVDHDHLEHVVDILNAVDRLQLMERR
jgi:hypothetical protein